jgi:hypothetical protein
MIHTTQYLSARQPGIRRRRHCEPPVLTPSSQALPEDAREPDSCQNPAACAGLGRTHHFDPFTHATFTHKALDLQNFFAAIYAFSSVH